MSARIEILTGPAGSGKSKIKYEELVDAAYKNPKKKFYLIVPEQAGSSMEQRILSINKERTGRDGFFNIDIIGFTRLAYRVFEEQGRSVRRILEDYGKIVLIRATLARVKSSLTLYRGSVDRQGFVEELKSLFSEFLLFDIRPEDLENVMKDLPENAGELGSKLREIALVYRTFLESEVFKDEYMVAEELPDYLARLLEEPGKIDAVDQAVFLFDGFTGFTAEQRKVLRALVQRAEAMTFTITMDPASDKQPLFGQSMEMYRSLMELAPEIHTSVCSGEAQENELSHLVVHAYRFPVREYRKPLQGKLSVWETANPPEELRVVAEDIRDRVFRGEIRYRDVAVLSPDLTGLSSYLDMVMSEYDLPYFLDYNRSFTNNPVVDAQLSLLEILDRDFSYESIFSFLKTGVLMPLLREAGLEQEDIEYLENHVMKHGIRGRKLWNLPAEHFSKKEKRTEMEEMQLEHIEEVRQLFLSVMKPVLRFTGGKEYPVRDMIEGLLEVARDPRLKFDLRGETAKNDLLEMGYPAEAQAYSGIQEKYISVLEKTGALLENQKMSIHDMRETLQIGVRELKIGVIPPTLDSVLIGDLERTRIGAVKRVYILQLNDGILPKAKDRGSILSDSDRVLLGKTLQGKELAPDETEKRFREQFSLYLAFSKARENLVLCYSLKDRKGKEMERSFLLGRVLRLFPDLKTERRTRKMISGNRRPDKAAYLSLLRKTGDKNYTPDPEEKIGMQALAKAFPEIPAEKEPESQGKESLPLDLMNQLKIRISISKMEQFAACPYSYFLKHVLRLNPRQEHRVSNMDIGQILHKTFELVFEKVKNEHGNDWKGIPEETLSELVDQGVYDAVRENLPMLQEKELQDGKTVLTLQQIREMAYGNVEMLQYHLRAGDMLPEYLEGAFEAEFDAKRPDGSSEVIRISGVADRVDTYRPDEDTVYLKIIDYKTQDKKLDLRDVRDGRELQLAVYIRLLTEILGKNVRDCVPAGMYFYHVDRPVLKELAKRAANEEEGAQIKLRTKMKLRGVPNVSPADGEESDLPAHYVLELQDHSAVDEDRKICATRILPLSTGKGSKENNILASTEELRSFSDYALKKCKDLTEQILCGDIRKRPTRKAGDDRTTCKYCDAAAVCRFRKEASPENYVRKDAPPSELFAILAEKGKKDPVRLRNAHMKEKADAELLAELMDEADETPEGEDLE